MEEVTGQRPRTRLFRWDRDGNYYHIDTREPNSYVCISRTSSWRCLVRVIKINNDYEYANENEHTHPEEQFRRERLAFIAILRTRALQHINERPGTLFDRVSRENGGIAFTLTRAAGIMIIHRARNRLEPDPPQSMAELGPMLQGYLPAEEIFQKSVQATDGSHAIVFASNNMFARLNVARELHADGTFKGVAAVYVLCEKRTSVMYQAIWQYLLERAPDLRTNLRAVYGDYEGALMASVRETFPAVAYRGCWLHFILAVTRKWNALGLWGAPSETLHFTWALALAPAEKFADAIDIIADESRQIEAQYENVVMFIAYLRRQWLPLARIVSVFMNPVRTNNLAEGFNKQIAQKFGRPYPQLGYFIYKLSEIIADVENRWNRLMAHQDLARMRRTYQIADDTHIRLKQTALMNNECTLREFLQTAMVPRRQHEFAAEANQPAGHGDRQGDPDPNLFRDRDGVNYEPPQDIPVRNLRNSQQRQRRDFQEHPPNNDGNRSPTRAGMNGQPAAPTAAGDPEARQRNRENVGAGQYAEGPPPPAAGREDVAQERNHEGFRGQAAPQPAPRRGPPRRARVGRVDDMRAQVDRNPAEQRRQTRGGGRGGNRGRPRGRRRGLGRHVNPEPYVVDPPHRQNERARDVHPEPPPNVPPPHRRHGDNNDEPPIIIIEDELDDQEPVQVPRHPEPDDQEPVIVIDDDNVNAGPDVYGRLNNMDFQDEEVEQAELKVCCLCRENVPKIMFLPCNHLCVCLRCDSGIEEANAQELLRDRAFVARCPLRSCEQLVISKIRVWF